MKYYKRIKRFYFNDNHELKIAWFIAQGQWADGHLAYSRFDDNGQINEEDAGMYVQIRESGKLLMVRI